MNIAIRLNLCLFLALTSGCTMHSAGKVAAKTVKLAGSAASATTVLAVKTSGKVAAETGKAIIHTSGDVISTMGKAGLVTFKDTATGISKEIPYSEGLRLYAASQSAKVNLGLQAFEIFRDGVAVIKAKGLPPGQDPLLKSGDLIQFSSSSLIKSGKKS